MEHMQFKANQTAASYVANELDEPALEAFEMHMMECPQCVNDVEAWRVIKHHIPDPAARAAVTPFRKTWWSGWGIAASLVAVAVSGVIGWYARVLQQPSLDSTEVAVFNLPALTRGAGECTALQLAPDATVAILRVPGVPSERHLVTTDADGRELAAGHYAARRQLDGSWVVRLESAALRKESVQLATRGAQGADELLGCVTSAGVPPAS
jgi:hypothetical protein